MGIDAIALEGISFEDVSLSSESGNTFIEFADETLAILEGVDSLDADSFI